MPQTKQQSKVHNDSSLPVVEVLVVITITTALLLGVIISTNPLGKLFGTNTNLHSVQEAPVPQLSNAREVIPGGMSFATAMNEFPQVIGGYVAPYHAPQVGDPYYIEISIRDRIAPVTKVIAKMEGQIAQEIPLTLIDGTQQDGTWGALWNYTGTHSVKIISYDEKNNTTEVGVQ